MTEAGMITVVVILMVLAMKWAVSNSRKMLTRSNWSVMWVCGSCFHVDRGHPPCCPQCGDLIHAERVVREVKNGNWEHVSWEFKDAK